MFSITKQSLLKELEKVIVPIVTKFEALYNELPLMWDKKMQILNFFKVFEAYVTELKSVILRKVKKSPEYAKETVDFYQNNINQTLNSFMLLSLTWSYSGILDVKNRRKFENVAAAVDNGYKLNLVTSKKLENLSFFDLVFDFEKMHWITVSDLEDFNIPIQMNRETLVIMSEEYLKYSNYVNFLLRNSKGADFGLVIAGNTPTFKSTILKSISHKYANKKMWLPMSCYMTLPLLKSQIGSFAGGVKRKDQDSLILIDDLHLQSNLKIDVLEYLRMWIKNRGHYNIQSKSFDSLSNLRTIMTFDLKYILDSSQSSSSSTNSKCSNIDISANRYTYYCHSLYIPPTNSGNLKQIFQGIISYRLDSLYDHPLNALQVFLLHSMMAVHDYFRKNILSFKSMFYGNGYKINLSLAASMHNKICLLNTVLARALDKEDDIDTSESLADVFLSLVNQIF